MHKLLYCYLADIKYIVAMAATLAVVEATGSFV